MPASSTPWFPGVPLALGAAFLFGLSMPAAKPLLAAVDPWLAAGLLYAGAGAGLALVHLTRSTARSSPPEAPLRRADLPWLAGIVVAGGVLAPLLLMFGLARSDAASASLLLNLEGVATLAIAWLVAREHVDRKLVLGALSIIAEAVLLSWRGAAEMNSGAMFIALACAAWGIDNNLTRRLSSADPIQIAMIKGLFAGTANLGLSLAAGSHLPDPAALIATALVGFVGYGISLVLFVSALRHLGTARTGAYFSLAPLAGATGGIVFLREELGWTLLAAGALMAIGLYLHLAERHDHEHAHEAFEHDHVHGHDQHHCHAHAGHQEAEPRHAHRHRHAPLVHRHPHYPDLHHRHLHPRG